MGLGNSPYIALWMVGEIPIHFFLILEIRNVNILES
jgi:hypothetical protein